MDKLDQITAYADAYVADYGFEAAMVQARQRLVVEILARERPRRVVEVGCGMDMLHRKARAAGLAVDKWLIVEPAAHFFECARRYADTVPDLIVARGFFENSVDAIRHALQDAPDMILLSGCLHEVPDPIALLAAARRLLAPGGIVHVNVPSALSLHRRLAVEMGLIGAVDAPSERQKALNQPIVYDAAGLRALVEGAGFAVADSGGYLIKPFTHAQMDAIAPIVTDEMLDGLWKLGRQFPELASEIYLNAR